MSAWASRKDLREAVEAACQVRTSWRDATAYLRGQILYRMAEMIEGRRDEFAAAISSTSTLTLAKARKEVEVGVIDLFGSGRLGRQVSATAACQNPVAGPCLQLHRASGDQVVGVPAPDAPSLLD